MYYFKKATTTSPTIIMDSLNRAALIKGVSTCTDEMEIATTLSEVKSQFDRYSYSDLNIQLETFNTKMAKSLLSLLKSLKEKKTMAMPIINWICDESDIEMKQMGEDYKELLGINMNIFTA